MMSQNDFYSIQIDYNPYNQKVTLKSEEEGKECDCSCGLCKNTFNESLARIVEKIIDWTQGEMSITIHFTGRNYEYALLKDRVESNYKQSNKKITFEHTEKYDYKINEIEKKIKALPKDVFENESKYEEILRQLNTNIEMYIVGLYSSGKSTFINAMFGDSVLFTHSDVATNKLYKIIASEQNSLQITTFKDNKQISQTTYQDILTVTDILKTHNEAVEIDKIHLEIDIPNINSSHFKLELIDSPGVNNASNTLHQKMVCDAIRNTDNFPPVIMILNANNYKSNDQDTLFSNLHEVIKDVQKDSKQINLERFFFIINRADEIKFDEYQGIFEKIKQLIESKVGNGVKIYSTNAEYALLIRKQLKSNQSNKKVNRFIEDIAECNEINYLPKFSTGSSSHPPVAIDENDSEHIKLQKALEYTGIPMVEEALQEYLTNYAVVQVLEYTFKQLETVMAYQKDEYEKDMEELENKKNKNASLTMEGESKEKQIKKLNLQQEQLQKQIKGNNDKKKHLEEFVNSMKPAQKKYQKEIEELKLDDSLVNNLWHKWTKFFSELEKEENNKTYPNKKILGRRIDKIDLRMFYMMDEIRSELNANMREDLRNNAKTIINDFYKVIDNNLKDLGKDGEKFKTEVIVKLEDDTSILDVKITHTKRAIDWMDLGTLFFRRMVTNTSIVDFKSLREVSVKFKNQLDAIKNESEKQLKELKEKSKSNLTKFKEILNKKQEELDSIQKKLQEEDNQLELIKKDVNNGEKESHSLKQARKRLEKEIEELTEKNEKTDSLLKKIDDIINSGQSNEK